ncbi:MAG: alpha/beta hydrolase-fold protein [Pseudomonadota bacterium]
MTLRQRVIHLLAAAGFAFAAAQAGAGELLADAAPSAALGRPVKFLVYLPDGYKDSAASYPVTYLLHGAGGDETDYRFKGGILDTMDAMIARGTLRPGLVVMPTTSPAGWWVDGASEKAETALMQDLIGYVETKYRASKERGGRAVAGHSMGAYGALNLALRHPDKFCAASIVSPAIYDPLPPETSASRKAPPFLRDGKFDPELWKSLNYPAHLERYKAQPLRVPMWIAAGDHDFLGIAVMAANLYWKVLAIQPKQAEFRVMDGDHDWMFFRDALPDGLLYIDKMCARAR